MESYCPKGIKIEECPVARTMTVYDLHPKATNRLLTILGARSDTVSYLACNQADVAACREKHEDTIDLSDTQVLLPD